MPSSKEFSAEVLIDELIDREGGFVNHPADHGGPTHWGITEAVARAYGFAGTAIAISGVNYGYSLTGYNTDI